MLQILLQTLKYELKLTMEARSKGSKVVRPSTIILILFGLFYVLSGIDIIPEQFVRPAAFGYIDDLIVVAVIIILTGSDIGGVLDYASRKIPEIRLPELKRVIPKSEVPIGVQGNKDIHSVLRPTDGSVSSGDNSKPTMGSTPVHIDIPDIPVAVGDEDDALYDDPNFLNEIQDIISGRK